MGALHALLAARLMLCCERGIVAGGAAAPLIYGQRAEVACAVPAPTPMAGHHGLPASTGPEHFGPHASTLLHAHTCTLTCCGSALASETNAGEARSRVFARGTREQHFQLAIVDEDAADLDDPASDTILLEGVAAPGGMPSNLNVDHANQAACSFPASGAPLEERRGGAPTSSWHGVWNLISMVVCLVSTSGTSTSTAMVWLALATASMNGMSGRISCISACIPARQQCVCAPLA